MCVLLQDFSVKMCANSHFSLRKCANKRYIAEHHPEHAIRFSKRGYRKDGKITNIPLYLADKTKELL